MCTWSSLFNYTFGYLPMSLQGMPKILNVTPTQLDNNFSEPILVC